MCQTLSNIDAHIEGEQKAFVEVIPKTDHLL